MTKPQGWLRAIPLDQYSSLNELSLGKLIGLNHSLFDHRFNLQFSFNLNTPLKIDPSAYITFHIKDSNKPPEFETCCYSVTNIKRWRLNIREYHSMEDFLKNCRSAQRNKYRKSKKIFNQYGCTTEYMDKEWSMHVPRVLQLYANVADRHGEWLYDRSFFEEIAKRSDYSLLSAWYQGEMIAMSVLQTEDKILHSICGGFDYHHSTNAYAYSWLNYFLIETAILSNRYEEVDAGITADSAKRSIGYHPFASRMDIYSKGFVIRSLLRVISPFIRTTIDSDGKLKRI